MISLLVLFAVAFGIGLFSWKFLAGNGIAALGLSAIYTMIHLTVLFPVT